LAELGGYFRQEGNAGVKTPSFSEEPWTKPSEIPSSGAPVAELGGYFRHGG